MADGTDQDEDVSAPIDMGDLLGIPGTREKALAQAAALRGKRQADMGKFAMLSALSGDPQMEALSKSINQQQAFASEDANRRMQRQLESQRIQQLGNYQQGRLGQGAYAPVVGANGSVLVNKRTGETAPLTTGQGAPLLKALPKPVVAPAAPGAGLSSGALDQFAETYATTGTLPNVGVGKAGSAMKVAIANRAKELHPDANFAQNKAGYGADAHSLSTLQKLVDSTEAFEKTAGKNLDTFLGEAGKVADVGSPLLNQPLRALDSRLAGNPNMGAFNAARQTAVTEIGKVLSGASGGGSLSDSARHEVEGLMGPDATLAQLMSAAKILKQDMANRREAYRGQIAEIHGRIGGGHGGATPIDSLPSAPAPQADRVKVLYQGKTLTIPRARLADAMKDGAQEVK